MYHESIRLYPFPVCDSPAPRSSHTGRGGRGALRPRPPVPPRSAHPGADRGGGRLPAPQRLRHLHQLRAGHALRRLRHLLLLYHPALQQHPGPGRAVGPWGRPPPAAHPRRRREAPVRHPRQHVQRRQQDEVLAGPEGRDRPGDDDEPERQHGQLRMDPPVHLRGPRWDKTGERRPVEAAAHRQADPRQRRLAARRERISPAVTWSTPGPEGGTSSSPTR